MCGRGSAESATPPSGEGGARPGRNARAPEYLPGIAALVERYDAFILDQWGVLHNGLEPYPGAIDCLTRLRAAGKQVLILSNSGKTGEENATLIARMGFDRATFTGVVSAGDDARDAIEHSDDPFYRALGRQCFPLCREGDAHLAQGLGLELVSDVAEASFLFVLSMDAPRQSVLGWEPVLAAAAARDLPMVCANPDFARSGAGGALFEAPGLLARRYAELGGRVRLHGKPETRIYETCLRRLACARGRVVAVGDSMHHDVLGAVGADLASVLVAAGVHREELGITTPGDPPERTRCAELFAQVGVVPDAVVTTFRW